MKKHFIYILSAALLIASCTSEDDLVQERLDANPLPGTPDPVTGAPGSANFEHMVSFGASFAAGVMDGALYTDGQIYSYPAQIAQQLMTEGVGGGAFNQPDINSVNGVSGVTESGINGRFFLDIATRTPTPTEGELPGPYTGDKSQLNNFGVGGIILGQALTPATGGPDAEVNPAFNSFYQRFATNPSADGVTGSSILTDALATGPTFFTSSLGGNDILGYAVNGGADDGIQITSAADFQTQYTALINAMVASGSKGVVMNIAPVIFLPFFRAVPWNPVVFDPSDAADAANIEALNSLEAYGGFNAALDGLAGAGAISQEVADARKIVFAGGANGIVMIDEGLDDLGALLGSINPALAGFGQLRQSNASDLIVLSAAPSLSAGVGTQTPAGDGVVLTIAEQTEIITAAITFSTIIQGIADATNAAAGETLIGVVDIYPLLADVTGLTPEQATALGFTPGGIAAADGVLGIDVGGQTLAPDFSPNGIYSTDGVHPNPRGYALFANAFIETINQTFGANVPVIAGSDILSLRGIYFRL